MRKAIILTTAYMCLAVGANAQRGSGRLSLSTGLLYKNGLDVALACGCEINYRHAWESFTNDYPQWAEYESCKHVCPKSFWQNYRTCGFGVAYKLYVAKGRSHYGNLRVGASDGSDARESLVGLHFGYGHNYVLRAGRTLYWQVRGNVMIKRVDMLRIGVTLDIKLPIK